MVVTFLRQIASGMSFLHTRRPAIIHRDLNTNNVLVFSLSQGQQRAKEQAKE